MNVFVQIIISSLGIIFRADFWKYSLVAFITYIGFFIIVKYVFVYKMHITTIRSFFIVYPLIALLTVIPVNLVIIFYDGVVRIVKENDSEPILGLIINGLAYLYLNIGITFCGYLFTILHSIFKEKVV